MKTRSGLSGLVVKIASRCNLNCAYCYMYNAGDNSYRFQPRVMAQEVVDRLFERIISHCNALTIRRFELILHGGEPLLAGRSFIEMFARKVERLRQEYQIDVRIGLQTNGVILNREWCELLYKLSITIGISLDGPANWHDRQRKDHQQRGTHARTVQGLQIAQQYGKVGVLCVVDITSNPVEMYQYFKGLAIESLDFLWPDHHYESLPLVFLERKPAPDHTPFGDWWIRLFDYWFTDVKPKPRIRFLHQVVQMILGIDTGFETIGQEENRYLIIETDGGIEASDYLKACGNGFTKEGLNIAQHDLSEAMDKPLIKLHRRSHQLLPPRCKRCAIRKVCGGGHIAHRFRNENGFQNPSIYCFDLMKLLTHVQNAVLDNLSADTVRQARLRRMEYKEVLATIDLK